MNQALIKLTEERINNNTALSNFIEKAKAITIPLFPETVQFTDTALKYGAAVVTVNTQLDSYGNNRDVYKNESGGYCLHLSKLNEIAQQAGIQIIDSRILERKVDENGRVTFINHQVKGRMKSVDGSIKEAVVTGKYDYFRDYEKYIDRNGKRLDKMIASRRNHAEALAESNALSRLFTKLIAQIPTNFTLDELKKPFLIPYVIEDKDELLKQLPEVDQLAIKKDLIRKRLGIADLIYGTPEQINKQVKQIEEANVTVIEEEKKTEPYLTPEEENKFNAETFRESPQKERTEIILKLIGKKKWKHPAGVQVTASMIEKATIDTQIQRIEELLNIPDEVKEVAL